MLGIIALTNHNLKTVHIIAIDEAASLIEQKIEQITSKSAITLLLAVI